MNYSLNNIKKIDEVAEKFKADFKLWQSLGEKRQKTFLEAYTNVYPGADLRVFGYQTQQQDLEGVSVPVTESWKDPISTPTSYTPGRNVNQVFPTQVDSIMSQAVEEEVPVKELTEDEERNRESLNNLKKKMSFEPNVDRSVESYDGASSEYESQFRQQEIKEYLEEQKKIDAQDVIMNKVKNPATILPFVGDAIEYSDIYSVMTLADKFERGEDLDREQLAKLSEFVNHTDNDRTFWGGVAEVLTEMPTFMLEMGISGGLFNLGKKGLSVGVKGALNKVQSEGFKKKLAESFLTKKTTKGVANWVAKTGFQTGMIAESNLDKRVLEETVMHGLSDDTEGIIELLDNEELQADITDYVRLDEYIEVISENLGVGFSGLSKFAKRKLFKAHIIDAIEKSNPGKSLQVLQKYGYDGVLEEILEERAGEVLRGGAYKLGLSDDDRLKYKLPDRDQLLTEIVSFSILPMMTGKPAQKFDKFLTQVKNRNVLDKLNKRISKTKAGREILRAEKEGGYTFETLQQAKYFLDKNSNYDVDALLDFTNKAVEVTKEELEKDGRTFEEFGLDKDTEKADVRGSTELVEKAEGVLATLISLNRGADATTVIEEFAGHFYKSMTPEQSAKFTEYYQSVVEKGQTKLNEQEFFQKSVLAYFKMNEKQNAQGGIPIISSAFKNAFKVFKQAKSLFRRAVGSETVSEYSQRLFQNFLDGKLSTGNLEGNLNVQNFQVTTVQQVANKVKNKTKISDSRKYSVAVRRGLEDLLATLEDPNFDLEGSLEWYRNKVERAVSLASVELPQIGESFENRVLFEIALGITSHGTKVNHQYHHALSVADFFYKNKTFNFQENANGNIIVKGLNIDSKEVTLGGMKSPAIGTNFRKLKFLIDKLGYEEAIAWLQEKHTGKEIIDTFKNSGVIKDKPASHLLVSKEYYGFDIFGVKIGRYIANLHGIHEEAVYDVWFSRMWNRWMGTPYKTLQSGKVVYEKGKPKLQEVPRNNAEIDLMDKAMKGMQEKLKIATGFDWGVDQIQAVLWYYEKELYINHGSQQEEGTNYFDVAKERAETKGYYEQFTSSESNQDITGYEGEGNVVQGEQTQNNQGNQGTTPRTRTIRGKNYQLAPTFYSVAEKVIDEGKLKQKLGNNPKLQRIVPILRQLGVTKEELDWLDIDFLSTLYNIKPTDRIPLGDVEYYIKENLIDVNIVHSGKTFRYDTGDQYNDAVLEAERKGNWDLAEELNREWEELSGVGVGRNTLFGEWQLEGEKSNYGELLLTLPDNKEEAPYRGQHFNEENILGWVRYNIREVNGEKVFFIEEIQSDWHQSGRDKGYQNPETLIKFAKNKNTIWADDYVKLAQRLKTFIQNYNKPRYGKNFEEVGHIFLLTQPWVYQTLDVGRKEWHDWLSKEDKAKVINYKTKYSDTVLVVRNDKNTFSERELASKQGEAIKKILDEYKVKAENLRDEALRNAGVDLATTPTWGTNSAEQSWESTRDSMNVAILTLMNLLEKDDKKPFKLEPHESIELDEILVEFNAQNKRYEEAEKKAKLNRFLVPDAPFKGNAWQQLVLRKVLRLASEMNLDRVAWTTGKQQIDRYEESMRQNVDRITYTKTGSTGVFPNHVEIKAYKNGEEKLREIIPLEGTNDRGKTLQDYIGKSLANQIIEGKQDGEFAGDNLSIGGQGMKQAYDQNIPNYLKKYGKKWGAKLSRIPLHTTFKESKFMSDSGSPYVSFGVVSNNKYNEFTYNIPADYEYSDWQNFTFNRRLESEYEMKELEEFRFNIGALHGAIQIIQVEADEFQVMTQLPTSTAIKEIYVFDKTDPIDKLKVLREAINDVFLEIKRFSNNNWEGQLDTNSPVTIREHLGIAPKPSMQQSINITPEMKNSVLTVGQPQFQLGGVKDDVAPLEIPDEGLSGLLNRYFFDTLGRLEEVQKYTVGDADPYLKSMLFIGRSSNRIDQFRKRFRKPFIDKLRRAGFSMRDLGDYMYAIHALERDNHIRKKDPDNKKWENVNPSGLSNEAREEILDKFEGTNIYEFVKEIQENVIKRTLELQLAEGLITQETFDSLENFFDNYVPLKGKPGITTPASGLGQGFSTPKNVIKRAFGRESTADNPFIQALIDYEKAIIIAEKNKVAQELYQLVLDNPSDMWEVSGIKHIPRYDKNGELIYLEPKQLEDNEILVKFDGKAKKIKIYDTPLLEGMKKLGKGYSLKLLRLANNYLRSVFTNMNPEFVVSNFLRDSQTAFMHLSQYDQDKLKRKVYAGIPLAMKGIYNIERDKGKDNKWSDWYEEFKEQGGKMGWHDVQSVEEKIASLESEMNWDYRENNGVIGWTKDGLKSFYDWVDALNTSVENAVRLSTYKALVESGESKERSALLSKDLTVNFNRKGELANILNPVYLFFNAGLQGTNRMYRAFKHSKDVRLISGGLTLAGYLISQMNRYADPDEYEQYSDYILQNYWMILKQDGGAITMRLPYGWNVPVGLGVLAEKLHNETDYKPVNMFSDVISMFSNAFSPISGGTGLQTVMPTLTKPFVQHWENRDFKGSLTKKPQGSQRRPEFKMTWDDTPSLAKNVSEILNRVTGGNEVKPGFIDWNPEIMNHYIRWATGGAGNFLVNSAETLNSLRKLETPEIKSTPLVRQFLKTPAEYKAKRTIDDIEYRQMSEVMNDKVRTKLEGQFAFQQKILRGKIAEELDEKVKQSYEEDIEKLEMNKYRSLIKFDLDQLLLTTTSLPKYRKLVNHYYGSHRGDIKKAYKTRKTRKAFVKEWTDKYKKEWRTE